MATGFPLRKNGDWRRLAFAVTPNRRPFLNRPVPAGVRTTLRAAALVESGLLELFGRDDRANAVARVLHRPKGRPFETWDTRFAMDRIFADLGRPHAVLRLGHGRPVPMTGRRPVEEVMVRSGAML